MSQPYYSVAEGMLGEASIGRNLPGMVSPVRPGANAFDGGASSKPSVNAQPFNNERMALQEMSQNIGSAAPQAAANAIQQVRNETSAGSDAAERAQQMLGSRMSEALYANESGSAMMRLNSIMHSPDKDAFEHHLAVGKAQSRGLNPDLGDYTAEASRYRK